MYKRQTKDLLAKKLLTCICCTLANCMFKIDAESDLELNINTKAEAGLEEKEEHVGI